MRVKADFAVGARATRFDTGDKYAVAYLEIYNGRTNFGDPANSLMSQDSTGGYRGDISFEDVQVCATDSRRIKANNYIRWALDYWIGDLAPRFLTGSAIYECLHFEH
jgi:hypothetical protein